jgi:Cft2 family RNA processing exonuclease
MGSAGVNISSGGKSIFYTGDVHFDDHSLSKGARFLALNRPDALIMETTRGAVPRKADYTLASEQARKEVGDIAREVDPSERMVKARAEPPGASSQNHADDA